MLQMFVVLFISMMATCVGFLAGNVHGRQQLHLEIVKEKLGISVKPSKYMANHLILAPMDSITVSNTSKDVSVRLHMV